MSDRIYLSPPHLGGAERDFVREAFDTNWIAPLGPNVDGFEREFCAYSAAPHAAALASGTAALHLALLLCGVGSGDTVFVSDLTFVASANPVRYVGATPVFIDADRDSWNMDPALLEQALDDAARLNALPKAVIVVHLYGHPADLDPIVAACARHGVPLIEDAAEALGASYKGRHPGNDGRFGIYSFNGNKIITTSGGGMLVSGDADDIAHAQKLATQAREPALHYEHREVGFNYRLSNLCAGVGRGQLQVLGDRVDAKRAVFQGYVERLRDTPGLTFAPEASWARHTRWLTCATIDSAAFGASRDDVIQALAADNIEARPVWKPMRLQPLFDGCDAVGGSVGQDLFERGICLPSGTLLTDTELDRICARLLSSRTST